MTSTVHRGQNREFSDRVRYDGGALAGTRRSCGGRTRRSGARTRRGRTRRARRPSTPPCSASRSAWTSSSPSRRGYLAPKTLDARHTVRAGARARQLQPSRRVNPEAPETLDIHPAAQPRARGCHPHQAGEGKPCNQNPENPRCTPCRPSRSAWTPSVAEQATEAQARRVPARSFPQSRPLAPRSL